MESKWNWSFGFNNIMYMYHGSYLQLKFLYTKAIVQSNLSHDQDLATDRGVLISEVHLYTYYIL